MYSWNWHSGYVKYVQWHAFYVWTCVIALCILSNNKMQWKVLTCRFSAKYYFQSCWFLSIQVRRVTITGLRSTRRSTASVLASTKRVESLSRTTRQLRLILQTRALPRWYDMKYFLSVLVLMWWIKFKDMWWLYWDRVIWRFRAYGNFINNACRPGVGSLRHACHTKHGKQFPVASRSSKFYISSSLWFTTSIIDLDLYKNTDVIGAVNHWNLK